MADQWFGLGWIFNRQARLLFYFWMHDNIREAKNVRKDEENGNVPQSPRRTRAFSSRKTETNYSEGGMSKVGTLLVVLCPSCEKNFHFCQMWKYWVKVPYTQFFTNHIFFQLFFFTNISLIWMGWRVMIVRIRKVRLWNWDLSIDEMKKGEDEKG